MYRENPKKIISVYNSWELEELGLGRGVNGTNPRPWINKSSFQVRLADNGKENLIGTNEGGMLRDFVEEVTSIKNQTAKLDLSITVPNAPVTIGVGADLSRTWTKTQKAFGRQVLTRTIAFQRLFDESSDFLAKHILECSGEMQNDVKGCENVLKCKGRKECITYFETFFQRYNITHYVNSITLGASMFIVEAEADYHHSISPRSKLEYEPIASLEASAVFSKKLNHQSKDIKCIGKLSGENLSVVEKEAVVSIEVQPISTLFRNKDLSDNAKEALGQYLVRQKQKTGEHNNILCSS